MKVLSVVAVMVVAVLLIGSVAIRPSTAPTAAQASSDPYAVVEVSHLAWDGDEYVIPVEPNTGAHWEVYARWYASWALPAWLTETGSLDVDWNGRSWVISNAQYTNNILNYATCGAGACGSPTLDHGYAFKLMAVVNDPDGNGRPLVDVKFTAS